MTMEATINTTLKGGEWLVKESDPSTTFIPEDFNEEQRMIADMCDQFLRTEVLPNVERMDKMEPGYMRSLLHQSGDWAPNEAVNLLLDEIETEAVMRTFDSLAADYRISVPYIARVVRLDGQRSAPSPDVTTVVTGRTPIA